MYRFSKFCTVTLITVVVVVLVVVFFLYFYERCVEWRILHKKKFGDLYLIQ